MSKRSIIILTCIILVGALLLFFLLSSKNSENELVVSFYDNGSMGNYWTYKVDNEGIISLDEKSDYSNCQDGDDGCGGYLIYTIKPLKKGKVKLTFEWISHNNKLVEDAIYNIEVTSDLKIIETHSGSYFNSYYNK